MDALEKIITKMLLGLFLAFLYLCISFLGSFLSVCWEAESSGKAWFFIGLIFYVLLLYDIKGSMLGKFILVICGLLSIGMPIYYTWYISTTKPTVHPFGIYLLVNIIMCLGIIIYVLLKRDTTFEFD